ncbi:SH3 domain-containing protein [Streptomyces sp. NPDC049881]|uniref:SH3 domain-containing protein n=1 Tax=unclassified Streptomyces TaxID=2593676 RepID=UPI003443159B
MRGSRRWLVAGLSAAFLAVGLGAAPVAVADASGAAACTSPAWSDKSNGTGSLRDGLSNAPLRKGPSDGCAVVATVLWHHAISYDCYVRNSAGNTWTHVRAYDRFDNYTISGWIWDKNLNNIGALTPC